MFISGVQKLTLLDYPGKLACTVFTAGCNFRCPFCHNSSLVLPEYFGAEIPAEELFRFLRTRRGILEGVAVTGGEPLLHPELPGLLEEIKALGFPIKLDTNGSLPERLEALVSQGLVDRVAMDVKSAPEDYSRLIGVDDFELADIARSRDLLLTGSVDYEFRTTLVKGLHTEKSVIGAAKWIAGAREYYLQQYADSGAVISPEGLSGFSKEEMNALADTVRQHVPAVQVRGVR